MSLPAISQLINGEKAKSKFVEVLGKKANGFVTSVMQIVNSSNHLQNADPMSIYGAAMMAATLDLPINSNLGFAYIIPYTESRKVDGQWQKIQVAQFQIGYKGFIQLAQRTGLYENIAVASVYQGQLLTYNPLDGAEFDWSVPGAGQPIGYVAPIQTFVWIQKADLHERY